MFVQILGKGILVIIHYGDWFCRGKKFCSKQNKFFCVLEGIWVLSTMYKTNRQGADSFCTVGWVSALVLYVAGILQL